MKARSDEAQRYFSDGPIKLIADDQNGPMIAMFG